jgi:hypothetical protein
VEHAIGGIDDSDGYCHALMQRAAEIHLEAARKGNADPVALAGALFKRQFADGYDIFYDAVAAYADILGDAGLAEFRRLAEAAWAKLPMRTPNPRSRNEDRGDYAEPMSILDFFAARDGDLDARIALRRKDLSMPSCYLHLAQFCLEHRRTDEALRYAEEGLWLFDGDRPDGPLLSLVADLRVQSNRKNDAEQLLWRAFEKDPSHQLYAQLRKLGGEPVAERMLKFIAARSAKQGSFYKSLYASILIEERMFDEAWRVVRTDAALIHLRDRLAQASEATHPREAVEAFAARVETMILSSTYEEAVKLIGRMAKLHSPAEHTAYITAIKQRHERKRNLMKLLA